MTFLEKVWQWFFDGSYRLDRITEQFVKIRETLVQDYEATNAFESRCEIEDKIEYFNRLTASYIQHVVVVHNSRWFRRYVETSKLEQIAFREFRYPDPVPVYSPPSSPRNVTRESLPDDAALEDVVARGTRENLQARLETLELGIDPFPEKESIIKAFQEKDLCDQMRAGVKIIEKVVEKRAPDMPVKLFDSLPYDIQAIEAIHGKEISIDYHNILYIFVRANQWGAHALQKRCFEVLRESYGVINEVNLMNEKDLAKLQKTLVDLCMKHLLENKGKREHLKNFLRYFGKGATDFKYKESLSENQWMDIVTYLPFLKSLSVVGPLSRSSLRKLGRFSKLEALTLTDCITRKEDVKPLLSCSHLRSLTLKSSPLDDMVVVRLFEIPLEHLSLDGCENVNSITFCFTRVCHMKKLELTRCTRLVQLHSVQNFSNLQSLNLSHSNSLTKEQLQEVAKIKELQNLFLGSTNTEDSNLLAFKDLPLKTLSICACIKITPGGLSTAFKDNSTLESLNLSGNLKFNDSHWDFIESLKNLKKLVKPENMTDIPDKLKAKSSLTIVD